MNPVKINADVEKAVRRRYSGAAKAAEASLCCPVAYDPKLLEAIPREVIERDYGCGNPTPYLRSGETVLDLGSGTGKACFIASQVVGPKGRVIGIDMNDEMLALARRSAPEVGRRIGYSNVEFRRGRIQELDLDLDLLEKHLRHHPVHSAGGYLELESAAAQLRESSPLISEGSIDVVISNCVLNLVRPKDKERLFAEIFLVLKNGGRAVISDIVCDEDVPEHLQRDPGLWSGCISGTLREDVFLEAFEKAGFYGITVLERGAAPWRTVEGIEFRSLTIAAYKGKEGPCLDQKHAVVYRGPFREVRDDDGHVFRRGVRTAVCEKTFRIFSKEPYLNHVDLIEPRSLIPLEEAPPFPCTKGALIRHPRETKGAEYSATTDAAAAACCSGNGTNGGCCE